MRRADSFEKTLMLGGIGGRRRGGWQRMRWWDGITDSTDVNLSQLWEVVGSEAWRAAVHGVAKSQTQRRDWTTTMEPAILLSDQDWISHNTFMFSVSANTSCYCREDGVRSKSQTSGSFASALKFRRRQNGPERACDPWLVLRLCRLGGKQRWLWALLGQEHSVSEAWAIYPLFLPNQTTEETTHGGDETVFSRYMPRSGIAGLEGDLKRYTQPRVPNSTI